MLGNWGMMRQLQKKEGVEERLIYDPIKPNLAYLCATRYCPWRCQLSKE